MESFCNKHVKLVTEMSVVMTLNQKTIVPKAYYKALDELLKMFPEKGNTWIDKCRERLFDVQFFGRQKGRKVFKVLRNPKIDKYNSKFSYYRVYLYGRKKGWCSCFYGKYGQKRMVEICTHIGACILFSLYFEILCRG